MIGRGRSAIIGLLACLCLSFETGPVEPELEGKQVEIKKKAAQTKSRKPSRRTCLCKGGGFAIHCHSADEEGGPTLCALKSIPRPSTSASANGMEFPVPQVTRLFSRAPSSLFLLFCGVRKLYLNLTTFEITVPGVVKLLSSKLLIAFDLSELGVLSVYVHSISEIEGAKEVLVLVLVLAR
jgi:hypothetical protein